MTTSGAEVTGCTLHTGVADGVVLRLAPLSFWGGTDLHTGVITDERHPQRGLCVAGRVMVMPSGRGSSSSSSVLAEQLRAGVGPAAVVMADPDAIVVTGAIVAAELYGVRLPIVQVGGAALDQLRDGATVRVDASRPAARVTYVG